MSRTLAIWKPDVSHLFYNRVHDGIKAKIKDLGLTNIAHKGFWLFPREAEAFYAEHRGKPFFEGLVEFMCSSKIVVVVLEGDDAVKKWRDLLGATDPRSAAEGTLRREHGTDLPRNAFHGSDSDEAAEREVGFFFSGLEQTSFKEIK